MTWIYPVPGGTLTQGFGPSGIGFEGPAYATPSRAHDIGAGDFPGATAFIHFHAALDLGAVEGATILAPQSGQVLDAWYGYPGSWADGGGWYVRVLVNPTCMYLIAHCSELHVIEGQHVTKGQHIADVGHTGLATGNHAHFWVRLGPRPYYDPDAFFYDPRLVLSGGALYGDARFEPGYKPGTSIPDTGANPPDLQANGDPEPMKFRTLINKGEVRRLKVRAFKPIREGASVHDKTLLNAGSSGRYINAIGVIDKGKLPDSQKPYGDVYLCVIYDDNGSVIGYVKGVDIRF